MSSSNPTPPNSPLDSADYGNRDWSAWWKKSRFPIAMASSFALLIGLLYYFQATLVVGTELNTADWQLRRFSFRRDPFTNTQLTAIEHSSPSASDCWTAGKNATSLLPAQPIAGHLRNNTSLPNRWDLVELNDGSSSLGRASILLNLVESPKAASAFWLDWTNREPKKAAVLWPAAQRLVAEDRYAMLPDLFELVLHEQNEVTFRDAVSSLVQTAIP